jgi:AcrR family transcriptional regulator
MNDSALKPRKRPGQLRARETVDRILDAAAHIFEASGYAATTTNHIAAAANISIGSLYQYYPNKDAIIVGLAERHIDSIGIEFVKQVELLRMEQHPIAEAIRRLLAISASLTGTSELHSLLLIGCPRTKELDEQLQRFEQGATSQIESLLIDVHVQSDNVRLLAHLLFVAADSALHQVILPIRRKSDRSRAMAELVSLLTNGLRVEVPPLREQ